MSATRDNPCTKLLTSLGFYKKEKEKTGEEVLLTFIKEHGEETDNLVPDDATGLVEIPLHEINPVLKSK